MNGSRSAPAPVPVDVGIVVALSLEVTWLEGLDPTEFESLNTPADLERFHAAFSAQR